MKYCALKPICSGVALVADVDLLLGGAEIGVVALDAQLALLEADAHAPGLVRRHERNALERLQKRQARHGEGPLVLLRDDLVVGRELPVDELDGERDVVGLEHEVARCGSRCRVGASRVSSARRSSMRPLRGMRTPVASLGPPASGVLDLREPVAVGRDHAGGRAVRLEQHAVQVVARLVQRDGEDRLGDHVAQRGRVDLGGLRLAMARQLRVVAIGHADDLVVDLAGADLGLLWSVLRTLHLVVRQALDDLVQLVRTDGEPTLLLDLAEQLDGAS